MNQLLAAILVLAMVPPGRSSAQGTIHGTVVGADSMPVANALIHLTKHGLVTRSSSEGTFDLPIPDLPLGSLEVRAVCYQPTVIDSPRDTVRISLQPDPAPCNEDLYIRGRVLSARDSTPVIIGTDSGRELSYLDVWGDENGYFTMRVPAAGGYRFSVGSICYKSKEVEAEVLNASIDVGVILLAPADSIRTGDGMMPCPSGGGSFRPLGHGDASIEKVAAFARIARFSEHGAGAPRQQPRDLGRRAGLETGKKRMGERRRVVFLVGASGVGKTTVAQVLEERTPWNGNTHFFDTIGIPSAEEMESEFGSGEEWQRWATRQWVSRLAGNEAPLQLIEGQTRPSFINEAAEEYPDLEFLVVLLDCDREVRSYRLTELRRRPELDMPDMDNWAAYLAGQAHALGLPVVDTSDVDPEAIAQQVEARVGVA